MPYTPRSEKVSHFERHIEAKSTVSTSRVRTRKLEVCGTVNINGQRLSELGGGSGGDPFEETDQETDPSGDVELLGKDRQSGETVRITIRDVCTSCAQLGPTEIDCSGSNRGFGVRYRNFDSSNDTDEIYLGKGDLGVMCNRTQSDYIWGLSPTELKTWNITFLHDAGSNTIMQTIQALGGLSNALSSMFTPILTGNYIVSATDPGCTVFKSDPKEDFTAFQINVSNRDVAVGNQVIVSNLLLTTSKGVTYAVLNDGALLWAPAVGTQIFRTYQWPDDGSTPVESFVFTCQLFVKGTPSSSSERMKFEIDIVECTD